MATLVIEDVELFLREEAADQAIAATLILPWHRELKAGDYFVQFANFGTGFIPIFSLGMAVEMDEDCDPDEYIHPDYLFTKSFSALCPDGELGDVHRSRPVCKLTKAQFELFAKKSFKVTIEEVKETLSANLRVQLCGPVRCRVMARKNLSSKSVCKLVMENGGYLREGTKLSKDYNVFYIGPTTHNKVTVINTQYGASVSIGDSVESRFFQSKEVADKFFAQLRFETTGYTREAPALTVDELVNSIWGLPQLSTFNFSPSTVVKTP